MADALMMASIGLGVVNAILAGGLLAVYAVIVRRTRAPFALALIAFAAAFLAQNLLVVYAYAMMTPIIPDAVAPYLLGIGAFGAAGLGAMLWTATR